jgi:hypothetical protein
VEKISERALGILASLDVSNPFLTQLITALINRKK